MLVLLRPALDTLCLPLSPSKHFSPRQCSPVFPAASACCCVHRWCSFSQLQLTAAWMRCWQELFEDRPFLACSSPLPQCLPPCSTLGSCWVNVCQDGEEMKVRGSSFEWPWMWSFLTPGFATSVTDLRDRVWVLSFVVHCFLCLPPLCSQIPNPVDCYWEMDLGWLILLYPVNHYRVFLFLPLASPACLKDRFLCASLIYLGSRSCHVEPKENTLQRSGVLE